VTTLNPADRLTTDRPSGLGGLRARLRDARIRVKLALILVIPIVAMLGLAADRIVERGQEAFDTELVRSLAELSVQASAVTQELHREQMTAAAFLADPAAKPDQYIPQIRRTDKAVASYLDLRNNLTDVPAPVSDRLHHIDQQLTTLDDARQQVLTRGDLTVAAVVLRYGAISTDLVEYRDAVGQIAGDTPLGNTLRAAAALSKTKLEMAQAQAVAFVALQSPILDDELLTSFLSTLTTQQESLNAFVLAATPQQRDLVSATITGDAVALADAAASDVIRSAGRTRLISAADASRSLGALVDLVRWAEQRIDADLLTTATNRRNTVIWQVAIEAAAVLIALILAITLALLLVRNLVRSLSTLRLGTLAVANRDLPETVARLSDRGQLGDHTPAEIAAQVRDPIQLSSKDEIGQVALAFNLVHREAVRVAAEQAALHTSVSLMFLNLARRSQSLVDQMIAQLDEIERDEEDPKRLTRLFRLDHLATRMRRNDENLLVLAGADSSPPRREDGLVIDILRAAQSEIEHYDRVEFGAVDLDVLVVSRAVNDVVRLLAEVIDNATRFSPPGSAVLVSARQIGDQVLIQVEDRGVGMRPDQVALLNDRLATPPTADISAFRMMGLAVSGRLAARYGIRVELRSDGGDGTTVYVTLPSNILMVPRSRFDMVAAIRSRPAAQPSYAATNPMTPSWHDMLPPALPSGPTAGGHAWSDPLNRPSNGTAARPSRVDDTAEMPIYQEVQAAWFKDNRLPDLGMPAAATPTPTPRPAPAPAPASAAAGPSSDWWQSPADDGWRAATAAARPTVRTQTRSGLPKRVPQAQLVPGGVDGQGTTSTTTAQRSATDVRGLLSAYQRGVQRGREGQEPPVSG
jgi:signal transduction histidine kinase